MLDGSIEGVGSGKGEGANEGVNDYNEDVVASPYLKRKIIDIPERMSEV